MLLRTTISNTKKFFQRTLESFKSFLSLGYERLPKTPPLSPHMDLNLSQSYRELDKFYTDFTDKWDRDQGKEKKKTKKKPVLQPGKDDREVQNGSLDKFITSTPTKGFEGERREGEEKKRLVGERIRRRENTTQISSSCSRDVKEKGRSCLVQQKLRELEMLDKSNIEHVLDIEEVLHYYSRLTCPAYVDIVDKFFMDMYTELSGLQSPVSQKKSSTPRNGLMKW
ncbi:hypothetical protein NMG60_11013396 [Bertholletia excelsa]